MTPPAVVWRGPVHRASGLGIASRAYVDSLRRQGVRVTIDRGHRHGGRSPRSAVLICHQSPSAVRLRRERQRYRRIILNTVWETTRIPRSWQRTIHGFDAICVPSQHNRRALRNSGVKRPVYIVPHGVNSREYTPSNPKLKLPQAKGRFVFVSVFGFQHRKNPEALLRAYWEQFSASDRVLLVIKTNGYAPSENEAWIRGKIDAYKRRLKLRKATAPVLVIGRRMSRKQLKGLYTLADAFVLPTRGEGVGLPFLEAMASGVPVIATGWGGQMDFLTRGNAFLVDYRLRPPAWSMRRGAALGRSFRYLFAESGQLWAEADIGSLKRQMKAAYSQPGLCRRKGRQGRRDALRWSWSRAGRAFRRVVAKVNMSKGG